MTWSEVLAGFLPQFEVALRPAASGKAILEAELAIGPLPQELRSLYEAANGLQAAWFEILPVEDAADRKSTWDGIRRANLDSPRHVAALPLELRARFLAFARVGGGEFAVYDRADESIWYEEGDQFSRTSLNLRGFIETCLREVKDNL